MPTQLQLSIQEVVQKIAHLDRVEEQLKITQQELSDSYAEHKKLERKLNKELKDIERLEGLSTKAIFYKILGSKDQQLEKERQEYLELSLNEEGVKKSIELLEYEENLLEAKLGSQDALKEKLESLKVKREEEIIVTDPALRSQLLSLSDKMEKLYVFKTQVEEAYEVAGVSNNLTKQVIRHLSKVKNWGAWSSGQSRNTMRRHAIKRDAIDRARNLSYQVKHHLNLLGKELRDIGKQVAFDVDISKFSNFSSFFFNNLITDWIAHQQLTTAIASAETLRANLGQLLGDLNVKKEEVVIEISELSKSRDDLLMT